MRASRMRRRRLSSLWPCIACTSGRTIRPRSSRVGANRVTLPRNLLSAPVRLRWTPTVVSLPVAGLHLGALSALAVAQPLFDLLGKNPDFLAARALIGWQVVALGLVLVLVPPLVALGLEALVGLVSRPLRAWVHLLLLGLFVALIAVQALKDIAPDASSAVLIALAALVAVVAAAGYARATALRSFVTVLSPAPAIFLAIF